MPLDPSFIKRISTWLKDHCAGFHCKACGSQNWTVGHPSGLIALDQDFQDRVPLEIVPLVPVICSRCGSVTFFSLAAMGAVPELE